MIKSSHHRPARPRTLLFILVTMAVAASVASADGPETIELTGVVRDFAEVTADGGHPDFEVTPDHGFDHYAGNVAPILGEDGKPRFIGGGFLVEQQWHNAQGRAIAPLLYNSSYGTVYGPTAWYGTACVTQDQDADDAAEFTLLSVVNNGNGTSSWTYHVREVDGGRNLKWWDIALDPSHEVMPGTTEPYAVGVHDNDYYGIEFDVTNEFEEGEFVLVLNGHFEGTLLESGVQAKCGRNKDTGSMFVPTTTPASGEGQTVLIYDEATGDSEGEQGYTDDGGIDSAESFAQWFRDVPGVNMSAPLALTFVRQEDGSYVFDDKADAQYDALGGFFPVDGELFGNSGGGPDHNYHFTFELHTHFTYDAGTAQVFEFAGDDDVWVFIDGKLAIDLGGIHSSTTQFVSLDRLGLEDGETYDLDFFFAERHRTQSNFRITTNLELQSAGPKVPSVTAAFD